MIVYGIKDWSDNVNPEIYDHTLTDEMFEYYNGDMKMNTDLDMNNHKITNLNNGTNASDAVNKSQLDTIKSQLDKVSSQINTVIQHTRNQVYSSIFGDHFYDLLETSNFNLSKTASGVVFNEVSPNLLFGRNMLISNYSSKYGVDFYPSYANLLHSKSLNQDSSFTFFMSFKHNTSRGNIMMGFADRNDTMFFPTYIIGKSYFTLAPVPVSGTLFIGLRSSVLFARSSCL